MVDIIGAIPLSVGSVVVLLVNSLIAFIALFIADKVIAHNVAVKRLFIMSIVGLFLTPIVAAVVLSSIVLPGLVSAYVLPLLVWIVLGEILIKEADIKTKLKVVVVAFAVYILLSIFLAPPIFALVNF